MSYLCDLFASKRHPMIVVQSCVAAIRISLIFTFSYLKGARMRGQNRLAWSHLNIVRVIIILNVLLWISFYGKLLDNRVHIYF